MVASFVEAHGGDARFGRRRDRAREAPPAAPVARGPVAKILGPLVELDVVAQTLDAGVVEASALVADPRVGHVHITGSEATRGGRRALGARARPPSPSPRSSAARRPGSCPGRVDRQELANAASALVAGKKANGGSNCLSPQVVLLADGWPQKDAFLDEVAAQIAAQPTWKAYYPGAAGRRDDVAGAIGNVFGVPGGKTVVRAGTLEKPGVDLAKPPPALVFDALHAALLKHEGSSALKAALNLLLRRGLGKVNVIPGLKGPKFGAALP
ncbi:hypothetical protein JL722_13984 [Aureococcus anophagefferens]|nr:hypothetical protein JL722_13984 [Aureococcus anophagefferens]